MAKAKKREDGRYQKSVIVGRKNDGSYMRRVVYGRTQKELELKAAELTMEVNSGLAVCENSITFRELADIWFNQYNPAATERWRYETEQTLKKHLLPFIGDIRIKDLRQLHLQTILSNLTKQDYKRKTIKAIKQMAVRIMKVAVDSDLLAKNPFNGVVVAGQPSDTRQPVPPETVKLITENWRGHRMGLPALLMLYAGLRRAEMLALRWEDIDFDRKVIVVNKSLCILKNKTYIKEPKTKAGIREVPIPNKLLGPLTECRRPEGPIFQTVNVTEITEMTYKRAWESYMNYLNVCAGGIKGKSKAVKTVWVIEKFSAHQLRHTYATMLFDANVDIKSAQKFLGHADIQVTLNIYTHLSKFKEDQAINALNEHLDNI